MKFLICLLILTFSTCSADENEDLQDFLDLELDQKGGSLFQTAPDASGGQLFLLKQIFLQPQVPKLMVINRVLP